VSGQEGGRVLTAKPTDALFEPRVGSPRARIELRGSPLSQDGFG
jgi:hypothetical protein